LLRFEPLERRALLAAMIMGTVFDDLNGNGLRESADPALVGATVELWDSGDNRVLAETDGTGAYQFTDLAAGTYRLTQAVPAGSIVTAPAGAPTGRALGDVVNDFRPAGMTAPAGLVWANGSLYIGDRNVLGTADDVVYKLNSATGEVARQFDAPDGYDLWYMTFDGEHFWASTEQHELIKFDASGELVNTFPVYVRGIAWDGASIWAISSDNANISQLDPTDGTEIGSIPTPDPSLNLNGLTFADGHLWTNSNAGTAYEIAPEDGSVLDSFQLPDGGSSALAFDGRSLWATARGGTSSQRRIFEVDITPFGDSGAQTVHIEDEGDSVSGVDFGRYQLGSVSGTVFNDSNGDGMGGLFVYLDQNENGTLDAWEKYTTTDANGDYEFAKLAPAPRGSYFVRQVELQPGWTLTAGSGGQTIPATSGFTATGVNFGDQEIGPVAAVGPVILVNQTTPGKQEVTHWADSWSYPPDAHPRSVATDTDGNFVVAWQSYDGAAWNAYARVFNANGTPRTDEFKVNSVVTGDQLPQQLRGSPHGTLLPTVAMDADGDFVVVFMGQGLGDDCGIFARLYDPNGEPKGAEFLVNTTTANIQENPAVAMDPTGKFIVTWDHRGKMATDPFARVQDVDVYAQRFDASGKKLGKQFVVAASGGSQLGSLQDHQSSVAVDGSGNFIVAWSVTDYPYTWSFDLQFQRYSASGTKVGKVVTVTDNGYAPTVAMNAGGSFAIVWASSVGSPVYTRLFGQQYNASGQPLGLGFQVGGDYNHYYSSDAYPSVGMDGSGNLVVAWGNYDVYGDVEQPMSKGVWAQQYFADGTPSEPFVVSAFTAGDQFNPTVAMTSGGNFVIAMSGYGPSDDQGIFVQRYALSTGASASSVSTPIAGTGYRTLASTDAAFAVLSADPSPIWPAPANPAMPAPAKVRMAQKADVFSQDDLLDDPFDVADALLP